MFSPSCPDCGGKGLIVKHFYAMPCPLCKANIIGNAHLTERDLKNQGYMEQWAMGERSPFYWGWLKAMVAMGNIKPDAHKPRKTARKRSAKKKVE